MRFCKLVPLDTFNIVQSLSGKPTCPPLSPPVHCLDPENDSPRGGDEQPLVFLPREGFTSQGLSWALYHNLLKRVEFNQ